MADEYSRVADATWLKLGAGSSSGHTATVTTYTAPATAPSAGGWSMTVGGSSVWLHPIDWGEETHRVATVCSDALGPVDVEVTAPSSITTCDVSPDSLGIAPTILGSVASFTIPAGVQGHLVIDVDGTTQPIFLAVLPAESAVDPADYGGTYDASTNPAGRYFAAGTDATVDPTLTTGGKLYVAGGALVRGKVQVGPTSRGGTAASNVTIHGRGVIDSQLHTTSPGRPLRMNKCTTATVTGLTWVGEQHWGVVTQESSGITYDWTAIHNGRSSPSVNDSTSPTQTPDGCDVVASSNVTVRRSLIHSYDDACVVKAASSGDAWYGNASTILFEDLVIVQGLGGNALECGYETAAGGNPYTISGVTYRRVTVVRKGARTGDTYARAALGLHNNESGDITDILYEDITVEATAENNLWIGLRSSGTGTVTDVTMRRVAWPSNGLDFIITDGSETSGVANITFDDCTWGGSAITDATGMTIDGTVTGVSFT